MNSAKPQVAQWSTTCFGLSADTSPMELESLQAHLNTCKSMRGGQFGWQYSAREVTRFLSGRVISSLLVLVLVLSIVASVL